MMMTDFSDRYLLIMMINVSLTDCPVSMMMNCFSHYHRLIIMIDDFSHRYLLMILITISLNACPLIMVMNGFSYRYLLIMIMAFSPLSVDHDKWFSHRLSLDHDDEWFLSPPSIDHDDE